MGADYNQQNSPVQRKLGAIFSYFYSFAQILVNLLYVPILLAGMGKDEYGLYQLIGSVMAYMSIMHATFSAGTTRFYCKYYVEGNVEQMENTLALCRRIYRIMALVAILVGSIVIIVMRNIYSHVLTEFQLWESSVMLGILVANLIVTMNNTINVAVINAHERFVFLKATQLMTVVLQPVVVMIVMRFYPYAVVVPCVQIILNLLCAGIQRMFARSVLGAKVILHKGNNRRLMRNLLVFSSGIVLVALADQIFWKANQLILGYLFGTAIVAVYGIGAQICTAYMPAGTAIAAVFMPYVSKLFHEENDEGAISDLFVKVGRLSLYPLLAVLTGFAGFGENFIVLWAGEGYLDAYWIALIIMIPLTVDLCQNLGLTIMQVMNKYYFRGKMYLTMALANVVAVVMVAPRFGAIGAAICTGVAMFLGNGIASNIYYKKAIGLDVKAFWSNAVRVAFPLCALGLFVTILVRYILCIQLSWWGLLLAILLYAAVYFAVAWLFCANNHEKSLVRSMVGKVLVR